MPVFDAGGSIPVGTAVFHALPLQKWTTIHTGLDSECLPSASRTAFVTISVVYVRCCWCSYLPLDLMQSLIFGCLAYLLPGLRLDDNWDHFGMFLAGCVLVRSPDLARSSILRINATPFCKA